MLKKFVLGIAAVAALGISATMASPPVDQEAYPYGDSNCSGSVTMADSRVIMAAYVTGRGFPDPYGGVDVQPLGCETRLDTNCDGELSGHDVVMVGRIANGTAVVMPTSCPA